MSPRSRWSRLIAAVLVMGQAAACASLPRTAYTQAEAEAAAVPGMVGVRAYADATAAEFVTMTASPQRKRQAFSYLALSGGGGDGADGARVLNGWTASGTRPEFTIVDWRDYPALENTPPTRAIEGKTAASAGTPVKAPTTRHAGPAWRRSPQAASLRRDRRPSAGR